MKSEEMNAYYRIRKSRKKTRNEKILVKFIDELVDNYDLSLRNANNDLQRTGKFIKQLVKNRGLHAVCDQRIEFLREKLRNKIVIVQQYETPMELFEKMVEEYGAVWGKHPFRQNVPDEIWASAILKWQKDEQGLYAITATKKKVRMNDKMPSMKVCWVDEDLKDLMEAFDEENKS